MQRYQLHTAIRGEEPAQHELELSGKARGYPTVTATAAARAARHANEV